MFELRKVPRSLRRAARRRMRAERTRTRSDMWRLVAALAGRCAGSAWLWAAVAAAAGALIWLFWPTVLTPKALRHASSASGFVEALWQVEATALALSAAIVTFSFATFSSSRIAQMGGSLPSFARSSGLLVGVPMGLVAIAACGVSLLAMPLVPPAPQDGIGRLHAASTVAATVLSGAALLLIPAIIRQSLLAGDRRWLQAQLRGRIERHLDAAVALFIERSYARTIMNELVHQHHLETAPVSGPPQAYRAGRHRKTGVVVDIRLRRLVKLGQAQAGGSAAALLNPIAVAWALGFGASAGTNLLWLNGSGEGNAVGRIFVVAKADADKADGGDLDRLHAQGLAAIREDDEIWYREATGIHREVLLRLIESWRRFGASAGRAPAEDEVGLRPLMDHLEAQVREIIELDREALARPAVEVPLAVGLEALDRGVDGAGLAGRMLASLGRMATDASQSAQPTAGVVQSYAADGVFMLLRACASDL